MRACRPVIWEKGDEMSKRTRARLLSFVLLLGVLTGVLATPDSQKASATQCCETCIFIFEHCQSATTQGPCYGEYWCCAERASVCDQDCYWC